MIIFDIIAIALVAVVALLGRKRGFYKTVMRLVAIAAAIVIAALLATPVSDFIYETCVKDGVQSLVSSKLAETGGTIAEKVDATYEALPSFIRQSYESISGDDTKPLSEVLHLDEGTSVDKAADSLMTAIVTPVAKSVLSSACLIILVILLTILFLILVSVTNLAMKLPVLKQMNNILGWIVGFVEGLAIAWVFCTIMMSVSAVVPKDSFLSAENMQKTTIVSTFGGKGSIVSQLKNVLPEKETSETSF